MRSVTKPAKVHVPRAERLRTLLRAKLVFAGGARNFDCIVKDISEGGARLEVSAAIEIPLTFDLVIEARSERHRCQIIWRRGADTGVAFALPVGTERSALTSTGNEGGPSNNSYINVIAILEKRIKDLETENNQLKQHITAITEASRSNVGFGRRLPSLPEGS